jgi:hypothetical protein
MAKICPAMKYSHSSKQVAFNDRNFDDIPPKKSQELTSHSVIRVNNSLAGPPMSTAPSDFRTDNLF